MPYNSKKQMGALYAGTPEGAKKAMKGAKVAKKSMKAKNKKK